MTRFNCFVQPDWRKKYPGEVTDEEHLDRLEDGNTLPARLREKRRLVYLDQAIVRQSVAREEARKSREKSIARSERSGRRRAKSKASEAPVEDEEVDQLAMDEVPAEELPETLQEEVPPVIGMWFHVPLCSSIKLTSHRKSYSKPGPPGRNSCTTDSSSRR